MFASVNYNFFNTETIYVEVCPFQAALGFP